MEVYSPTDSKIFTQEVEMMNSTAGFTFKIPSDASGGEYYIKIYNY